MLNKSRKMKAVGVICLLASSLYGFQSLSGERLLSTAEASEPAAAAAVHPKSDLQLAKEKGIVEGYPNDPDLHGSRPITRAELVTMVNRAAKLAPSDNLSAPFPDLDDWQLEAVANAVTAGIVQGNEFGRFEPNRAVTREELAVMIVRILNKGDDPKVNTNVLNYFKDKDAISSWARPYVAYAVLSGLFDPVLGASFHPQGAATRDEAAKAIKPIVYQKIDILSTGGIRGHIESRLDQQSSRARGGIDTAAGVVYDYRSVNPAGTVVVDGGDAWQGTLVSDTTNGQAVLDAMARMPYDAAAIGSHEFDFGRDVLMNHIKQAPFPLLGANIIDDATGKRAGWTQPYTIIRKGGLQIGIIGLTTPQTQTTAKAADIEGLSFAEPLAYAKSLSAELKAKGCDLVLIISSLSGEQAAPSAPIKGELAELADGTGTDTLDAIVGGHSHRSVAGNANGIPVVASESRLHGLGHIQLYVDKASRKIVSSSAGLLETYADLTTPDPNVQQIAARYQAQTSEQTHIVIAQAADKWTARSFRYGVNGGQERDGAAPLGNSVTDAMRAAEQSDIAFTPIGGLAANIEPGKVTYGMMFEVLPFGSYNRTGTMTAEQIKRLLEVTDPASKLPALQFSGLKVEWDNRQPEGHKYTKITLTDGTPVYVDGKLNTSRTFRVTANDYLASGKVDGYAAFREVKDWKDGKALLDAWVDDIKARAAEGMAISLKDDGRDIRLDIQRP